MVRSCWLVVVKLLLLLLNVVWFHFLSSSSTAAVVVLFFETTSPVQDLVHLQPNVSVIASGFEFLEAGEQVCAQEAARFGVWRYFLWESAEKVSLEYMYFPQFLLRSLASMLVYEQDSVGNLDTSCQHE